MPVSPTTILQSIGLDSWIGTLLLLGTLTLLSVNYLSPSRNSNTRSNHRAIKTEDCHYRLRTEAKSKAYLPKHSDEDPKPSKKYNLPVSPGIASGSGWTIEKTMRVMSSLVVLLAAIYIIFLSGRECRSPEMDFRGRQPGIRTLGQDLEQDRSRMESPFDVLTLLAGT
ncbi:MAG: hypothetical protein CBC34_005540 [Hyphomicrobiaceae bacterium TMED74]|nr:hypothetical protein [Filomicrobium sp.]RPG44303.1 MAG: hypothetical protein CBC34_005540 [Hyphomicrobiaceae bacterium TMED74]